MHLLNPFSVVVALALFVARVTVIPAFEYLTFLGAVMVGLARGFARRATAQS